MANNLYHRRGVIQVAGVRSLGEAEMLRAAGVDLVGIPCWLQHHKEDLPIVELVDLCRIVSTRMPTCLITYLTLNSELRNAIYDTRCAFVQLHSPIETSTLAYLRRHFPRLGIIVALVIGQQSTSDLFDRIADQQAFVDFFITDTYDPKTGASGATGIIHDWTVSAEIVKSCRPPVILAGGLTAGNVKDAILTVRPAGVDAHTGLEDAKGDKDRRKVLEFVANARAGFNLTN